MKLSNNTKYAINWLFSQGHNIKEIANELKIKSDTISEYIEKNNIQNHSNLEITSSTVKNPKNLMIRHTAEKNINNVAIMTKAASEYNDAQRKNKSNTVKDCSKYIFKPNE